MHLEVDILKYAHICTGELHTELWPLILKNLVYFTGARLLNFTNETGVPILILL